MRQFKPTPMQVQVARMMRVAPESGEEIRRKLFGGRIAMKGHFELSQQLHSDTYFKFTPEFFAEANTSSDCDASYAIELLCNKMEEDSDLIPFADCVIGPMTGGAHLANLVSRQFSERLNRRVEAYAIQKSTNEVGLEISDSVKSMIAGKNIIVVDDVLSTGYALAIAVIPQLEAVGAKIIHVAVLANRGKGHLPIWYPFTTLWKTPPSNNYHINVCPMCKAGVPITRF